MKDKVGRTCNTNDKLKQLKKYCLKTLYINIRIILKCNLAKLHREDMI